MCSINLALILGIQTRHRGRDRGPEEALVASTAQRACGVTGAHWKSESALEQRLQGILLLLEAGKIENAKLAVRQMTKVFKFRNCSSGASGGKVGSKFSGDFMLDAVSQLSQDHSLCVFCLPPQQLKFKQTPKADATSAETRR